MTGIIFPYAFFMLLVINFYLPSIYFALGASCVFYLCA